LGQRKSNRETIGLSKTGRGGTSVQWEKLPGPKKTPTSPAPKEKKKEMGGRGSGVSKGVSINKRAVFFSGLL